MAAVRREREIHNAYNCLISLPEYNILPEILLRHIAQFAHLDEQLTDGIVCMFAFIYSYLFINDSVFREGDLATCWYILLAGTVNITAGANVASVNKQSNKLQTNK
jgi:hypothetical protein